MVFSIPSYLCTGDRPARVVDARAQGATFLSGRSKTGHNPDALFDHEFRYMWNGVRSKEALNKKQRESQQLSGANISKEAFVPTVHLNKPEGLGSLFGCIQKTPYPHMHEHPTKLAPLKEKKEAAQRGIFTTPSKKGTGYGFPHLALSSIGDNYIATIYNQPHLDAVAERKASQQKMPPEPFKPAGRQGYTFDESMATGSSRCYIMTVPFTPKPEPAEITHYRHEQVWRPAGYVEDKPSAMEYWEDPYDKKDPREDGVAAAARGKTESELKEAFKPASRSDNFWYTQSIAFKRL